MFKRRNKSKFFHKVKGFLWPSLGWKRSTQYLFHRIGRLPGTPYSTAAGFACGAAISFTPFVGLHIVLAILIAWVIRANIMAAVIGTAVGNPWTFPLIWTFIFNLGVWLGGASSGANASEIDFQKVFSTSLDAIFTNNPSYLFETAWLVLGPMFIGGIPTSIAAWLLFYFSLRPLIKRYQSKRSKQVIIKNDVLKKWEKHQ